MNSGRLQLLLKSGTICNLACSYCGDNVAGAARRIDLALVAQLATQIAELPCQEVVVAWHGGEPLTAGRGYLEAAFAIFDEARAPHQALFTCVHTNGILLDDAWLAFFGQIAGAVSVSLDGPREFHDRYRRAPDGTGSFEGAVAALDRAARTEGGASASATVHDDSESIAERLLAECVRLRANQLLFEPRLARGAARRIRSVSPAAFIRFADELQRAWTGLSGHGTRPEVPFLSEWCRPGEGTAVGCTFCRGNCFSNLAIDWSGDVYPCDLFHGVPSLRLGNVRESSLFEITTASAAIAYRTRASHVPAECADCPWAETCRGGCPYHRLLAYGSFEQRTPYCRGNS